MDTDPKSVSRALLDSVPSAMRAIRAEMRSRRGADLPLPHFRALLFLQRNAGAPLKAVADHLGLTCPTVSKMIQGLAERGLVERPDSKTDRRRVALRLTPKGNALVDRVRAETASALAEKIASLPAPERAHLAAALQTLDKIFRPASSSGSGAHW
jgi:DNA-binding MarR family transcriptional regulator